MADIGIMGGTFDPIHNGHLLLGEQAYREYGLAEVWFMPSGDPPHKTDHRVTPATDRYAMVRLAIQDRPYFRFSDFEVMRTGKTYTAQTLRLLREQYPQHRFFFIIGADSLYEIEHWYHPESVMAQTILLVANREYEKNHREIQDQIRFLKAHYEHADIRLLHCAEMDVSSCELRRWEADGQPIQNFVPGSVNDYIEEHGLYHPERRETT